MNYQEGATARDRNEEVGGHKGWIIMMILLTYQDRNLVILI
jgi:hypothetical protein